MLRRITEPTPPDGCCRGSMDGRSGEAAGLNAPPYNLCHGSGLDTIFDFEDGRDMIDLTGFQDIAGFDQVSAQSNQSAGDVVIDFGAAAGGGPGADVLTLAGFALVTLDPADFASTSCRA